MSQFHKHSEKFIERWANQAKKGFVVSLPGEEHTKYADGETVLSDDLKVTQIPNKTIELKLFSQLATFPSLERIVDIETRLPNFLDKTTYLQEEAKQNQYLEKLISMLDAKEIDTVDFIAAIAQFVKKEELVTILSDLAERKRIADAQNLEIIELKKQLENCVIEELNFEAVPKRLQDPNDNTYGAYYADFSVPATLKVHCVRVYGNGPKLKHSAYTYTESGGVCTITFKGDAANYITALDIEVSFKKKMI